MSMGQWEIGPGIVEFPNGTRIRGRGLSKPFPSGANPELGLYLLGHEPQPTEWEQTWLPWRDFRLPTASEQAIHQIMLAFERAADKRLEVACHGGKGRTGTVMAIMARLSGVPAEEAVRWVREHYHRRAVETWQQKRWVRNVALPAAP